MNRARHLTNKDYATRPWKNGRGKTTEIAVDSENPYRWRLSTAKLSESAPFSEFAGYDRQILLLNGGPVTLKHTGRQKTLTPFDIYRFSGDEVTQAEVREPGEDFNIFTLRPNKASPFVVKILPEEEMQLPLNGFEHFVYVVSGETEIQDPNSDQNKMLLPQDLYWLTRKPDEELINLRLIATRTSILLWVIVRLA